MPTPEALRHAALPAVLALVAGCSMVGPSTAPPPGDPAASAPASRPVSDDVTSFLRQREASLVSGRRLRTDPGQDIALSAEQVARIYAAVALTDEYQMVAGGVVARSRPAPVRRWVVPVRLALDFGADISPRVRQADSATVADLAATLARATGHPVTLAPAGTGNFHVLVLSEAERRAIGPRLRQLVPGIDATTVRLVETLPLSANCIALAFARDGGAAYSDAVAIIRAEHPDLTRTACLHEEIAQGLGLASDSAMARPSIFNDDFEFARLTWLDLTLLRLHYDPRLQPGMTAEQAMPIVRVIASELVGQAS